MGNNVLHITSTHFDEPRVLAVAQSAYSALTIHGEGGSAEKVFVGGGDIA